jgi:chromosome segregation ATPase
MTTDTPRTDTPRTDAAMSLKKNHDLSEKDCPVYENYVHAEVCAEIERELNEYIDENMKLWKIIDGQEGLMRKMQADAAILKEAFKGVDNEFAKLEANLRRERKARQKAKAEVERLRANLRRAIEIAEEFSLGGVFALEAITASGRWAFEPQNDPRRIIKSANDKFNQLKATINQDNK